MRLAGPAALIFLAGVAIGRRGTGDAVLPPDPPREAPCPTASMDAKEVRHVIQDQNIPAGPSRPVPQAAAANAAPEPPPAAAVQPTAPSPLLARLQAELGLDGSQSSYVARILREREDEIRDCHERYRRGGVLDVRDYDWWITDRKAIWFRRVDAVLDRYQHEQWVHLAGRNVLGEGLEFEVADGMAVLE